MAVVVEPRISLAIESNVGHQAGVRAVDLRKLSDYEADLFRVKPEFSYSPEKVISFLVDRLGARFDYPGVLWLMGLKLVGLLTGLAYRPYNRFQREKDYFCSELVSRAFVAGGLDIVPEVSEAEVASPADIARSARLVKVLF